MRGLVGVLAGCMLAACSLGSGGPNQSRGSGSLALSTDDKYLYAADTDNGIVAVIDAKEKTVIEKIQVGKSPTRVAVGSDDTIYVTNRDDRSVSVIRKGEWVEAARIPVGVEPAGLTVAPDGKTLYVVNSATLEDPEVGSLVAIDTASLQPKWETQVGSEPRGIAIVAGNRAVISLSKEGTLVEVDLNTGKTNGSKVDVYQNANATKLNQDPNATGKANYGVPFSSFKARGLSTVTATPNGDRVFVPGVWAREDKIDRSPSTQGGYYSGGGPCNVGSVATPALITADTTTGVDPKVDDLTSCYNNGSNAGTKDYPPSVIAPKVGSSSAYYPPGSQSTTTGLVIQGPSAAAVDSTGSFLYVVNKEGKSLAVMPAYNRVGEGVDYSQNGSTVQSLVSVGAGADGIALSLDGKHAYVYSQFDHRVDVFEEGVDPKDNKTKVVAPAGSVTVAEDTLSVDLAEGRRLFHDARDTRMSSSSTNVACSSCHGDARDDGHVWSFPDGLRQTPSLAGRGTLETGPWHWSGAFTAMDDFYNHTIKERMGGTGLNETARGQMKMWIDSVPAPDNALKKPEMNEAQARGAQAFTKAGCNSCHSSQFMTNDSNVDVGTLVKSGPNPDTGVVTTKGFNVPSLRDVARTAPYLHDGSVKTLDARVFDNTGDKHGTTSGLSEDEKSDLVAYLKTL